MCGVNLANIFVVGLLSGLIGAGVAYFFLVKSTDFQWWWLLALLGVQLLSVIAVAYTLQKTSGLNTMFSEAPVLIPANYDWSNLYKAPKIISSDCVKSNDQLDTNSADWQDLLKQLDQISNGPALERAEAVFPGVTDSSTKCVESVSTGIQKKVLDSGSQETLEQRSYQVFQKGQEDRPILSSHSDIICMSAVTSAPASTATASTLDFSAMASALATSVSVVPPVVSDKVVKATVSIPVVPVTKTAPAPVIEPVSYQGIDFSSFFR